MQGIPDLEWKPKLSPDTQTLREMATQTVFRRDIWCLEFTFKPVRMIWVDVPQASGKMQRKLIWYMVYHVKNTGKHLKPTRQDDGTYTMQAVDREVRFFPQFVLETHEYQEGLPRPRSFRWPLPAIQQKEDPNRKLLNSVEIGSKPIPVSSDLVDKSVWGVATWEDVDPRIDFFSVYVQGLTNAYQWVDPPGRVSSRAIRPARAACCCKRRCSSTSGVPATSSSRTSGSSATASQARLTTVGVPINSWVCRITGYPDWQSRSAAMPSIDGLGGDSGHGT